MQVDVFVVGRDADGVAQLCYVANARSVVSGNTLVAFRPLVADVRRNSLSEALAGTAGVVLCASTQSPWERLTAPSSWTGLLERSGFGSTLPLQAELAPRVDRTLDTLGGPSWFVNACFPDAVNPLLTALGVPVLCGIGNVAVLATSLQAALGLPDQTRLQVPAHHAHPHAQPLAQAPEEALAWRDGQGPLGLPDGYPVRLSGTELRLPAAMSQADAIEFNQRAYLHDGIMIDDGRVMFGPAARHELERAAPELADGFDVMDLDVATSQPHALRGRLRNQPPSKWRYQSDAELRDDGATHPRAAV